ncbi:MAG: SIR2 family protein [Saprospiraceae bacterium]
MKGILNDYFKIKKVFILGAGFSYSAGLPLTNDLLQLIHEQASKMSYGVEPWGQAQRLIKELQYYYPLHTFTHEKIVNGEFNGVIDIEEFLSFTSAESSFLYPGDKLTEHGSYFMSFCKKWIGEILISKQIGILNRIPNFYHDFVRNLENTLILTFNWDTILEILFESNNIDYRYQLNYANNESSNIGIPLVKMHGSIDWVSKRKIKTKDKHLEFQDLGDEFTDIVKAKGLLTDFYDRMYYPWIVLPNYDKITQLSNYGRTWETPNRYLDGDIEVIVIGYSLRPDDFHSRSFIYPLLVNRSRKGSVKVRLLISQKMKQRKRKSKIDTEVLKIVNFGSAALIKNPWTS